VRQRVARSRELVAQGRPAAVVARVAGISRQAIYRRPVRPPRGQRRPPDAIDRVVLEVARSNPTDGTRMVAALAGRELGGPVNRKRVQRLMREHRLLQRRRSEGRRRRPGFFGVERPDQLWHLDMTSVWVAEHGWCYLNAATCLLHARDHRVGSTFAAAHRTCPWRVSTGRRDAIIRALPGRRSGACRYGRRCRGSLRTLREMCAVLAAAELPRVPNSPAGGEAVRRAAWWTRACGALYAAPSVTGSHARLQR
jgi:hypothetical protein